MRKPLKVIVGASVLMAGLLAVPLLYAHEGSGGMPMMGQGSGSMMGGGSMMGPGSGNMMGMMNMMGQMGQMAQNCNAMMTSMMTNHGTAPNGQWKQDTPPAAPEHPDQSE